MKILVLSDSHSMLEFMRTSIEKVKPDMMIHLGDFYQDALQMQQEYPNIPLIHVPGNCDRYRCAPDAAETLVREICGVRFFLTHGHLHRVKWSTFQLIGDAKKAGADIVLYGHTHQAECYQDKSGMWVMNPGTCGYYGATAGIIDIQNEKIVRCWVINQRFLEE